MTGNERENISGTFGKYAQGSAYAGQGDVSGPRDITSDMWTPISTGKAPVPEAQQTGTDGNAEKEKSPSEASDGRKAASSENRTSSRKGAEKPKQGAPVKKTKQGASTQKKKKKKSVLNSVMRKLLADNSKTEAARQQREKQQQQRRRQQLNKDRQEYENQIKEGKSHIEISKKRAELKRKRRRMRNILTVALFFVFVAAFAGIYTYAKGAPIANIVIEGESIYSNKEITQAAGVDTGVNMFALREKTINSSVTSALPYIREVEIDRELPDTLIVKITPTTDKYLIVNEKEYICVDEDMKILSLKKKKLKEGSFRIYGLEKQDVQVADDYVPSEKNKEKFELVKSIVAELESNSIITSAVINVSDPDDIRILYNSKIMIYLGSCSQLKNQISLACNVIRETVSEGQTGYIDMRYSNMAFFNEGTIKAY